MNVNNSCHEGKPYSLVGLRASYYCAVMGLRDRIKSARRSAGLTQLQLAELVGVTSQAVTQWEVGQKRGGVTRDVEPSKENLLLIARHTGVPIEWLMTGHPLPEQDANGRLLFAADGVRTVPLMSLRQAVIEQPRSVNLPRIPAAFACGPNAFAVIAETAANSPTIDRGDKLIVDPDRSAEPGQIVLAVSTDTDEPSIGRLQYETSSGGHVTVIRPINQAYKALRSDHGPVRVVGVVTEIAKPLN